MIYSHFLRVINRDTNTHNSISARNTSCLKEFLQQYDFAQDGAQDQVGFGVFERGMRDNADCVQPCCIAENLKHILTMMALAANPMLKKEF